MSQESSSEHLLKLSWRYGEITFSAEHPYCLSTGSTPSSQVRLMGKGGHGRQCWEGQTQVLSAMTLIPSFPSPCKRPVPYLWYLWSLTLGGPWPASLAKHCDWASRWECLHDHLSTWVGRLRSAAWCSPCHGQASYEPVQNLNSTKMRKREGYVLFIFMAPPSLAISLGHP